MDIRIQLDQEIATYCALLQEEENRWALCSIELAVSPVTVFAQPLLLFSLLILFVCCETRHELLSLFPLSG